MKSFRPSLRRVIAVAAAALVGTAGAVLVASPASAHHPIVTGSAVCEADGTYTVTWTIKNSEHDIPGEIKRLSRQISGVQEGDVVPANRGSVTGTETVPGTTTYLSLKVKMKWVRGWWKYQAERTGWVKLRGKCTPKQPEPDAEFVSNCDGVIVTVSNGANATKKVTFIVTGTDGFTEESEELGKGQSEQIFVPKDKAGSIVVTIKGDTSQWQKEGKWEDPGECDEPLIETSSSCDEFTVKITNPQTGPKSLGPITVTPTVGDPQTIDALGQGESKEITFPASEGLKVTVDLPGDLKDQELTWETDEDCTPPTTTTPLPETGASVGGVIGTGAALLGLGGLLVGAFFVLRRRRATLEG